jgi:hypothetical protein
MVGALLRGAYVCVVIAFWFVGVRLTLGHSDLPWREVAVPWLQWIALPLFFLTTAAVMTTIPVTKWVMDRRYARDLQRQVRQNLTVGTFREIDAAAALHHLLHESVWGWRQYAKLNSWAMVDGLHVDEFERAALAGDIVTVARSSREGRTVVIERRVWQNGRIDKAVVRKTRGVTMKVRSLGGTDVYSQLAMAEADLMQVWPEASFGQRRWSRLWVWLKMLWYGAELLREQQRQRARDRRLS